jgi:hypothetical protein
MSERTCDFCGHSSPIQTPDSVESGYIEMRPDQPAHVLRLELKVEPGVVFGDFRVKATSYQVCTNCIFKFLQAREEGGL